MNYAIQYHESSGDWLIFDISDGFELVSHARKKREASRNEKAFLNAPYGPEVQWIGQHSLYMSCHMARGYTGESIDEKYNTGRNL